MLLLSPTALMVGLVVVVVVVVVLAAATALAFVVVVFVLGALIVSLQGLSTLSSFLLT